MSKPKQSAAHPLLEGFVGGLALLAIGPPKTGKSNLLGTIASILPPEEIALICPKPQEVNSYQYTKHGLAERAEVFRDHRWVPAAGLYEADSYGRMMRHIVSLYDDTQHGAVLFDPLTDAVALAGHELLKGEEAANPGELRDSIAYYRDMRPKLRDLVQTLVGLTSKDLPRPKHVLVAVHAQPTREEDIKKNPTKEAEAKGIQYFGDVLPMIEGSYRMDIAGEFDVVGYTSVRHEYVAYADKDYTQPQAGGRYRRSEARYLVQLVPDQEKHAGIRLAPQLAEKELPNNMEAVLAAIQEARQK